MWFHTCHTTYNSREPDTKNLNSTFVLCQSLVFRDNRVFLTNILTPTSGLSSGVKHLSVLSEISICSHPPTRNLLTVDMVVERGSKAPVPPSDPVFISPCHHLRFIIHEGSFTLSVRINTAMSLAILRWLNCSVFLINQVCPSKNGLQPQLISKCKRWPWRSKSITGT